MRSLIFSLLFTTIATAQPAPISITRTTAPIDLDGVLDDAAWQSAAKIDRFYETSPGDNTPPPVNTIAYVTYDQRYFYIGVRADDPHPERIRAPFVDRDGVIGTDDNIAIFLDTRNDKRSAIELRVNPRGIQADGIFNDANFNEDFSPDFYYDTAATIDGQGWSAEFRIPFSSLRYGAADPQTWNILVWRNYPREFRYAIHSAPIPRGSNCHICHAHPIVGLTGLPDASHFVVAPYAAAHQTSTPGAGSDFDPDAGIDVKWTPTANNAVDLTINPDFSQIEADVPQITVNRRFAVFVNEKRPFFLEGFDLFDTPMQAAHTRTINSPNAGMRATGKIGATAYTLLVTQDEGGGLTVIPGPQESGFALQDAQSYATIGRLRRDYGASFVGAALTSREIDGGGHNRVLGPDFQWRPSDSDELTAQLLFSDTDDRDLGVSDRSHALEVEYAREKRSYDWYLRGTDIGNGFRADLGFMPQVGYRELNLRSGLRYYPEHSKVRFFRPGVELSQQNDQDGQKIYDLISLELNATGAKNMVFQTLFRPRETIRVGDRLLEQTYGVLFFQFDPSRRFSRIFLDSRFGESIDFEGGRVGTGATIALGATVRPHDRLDLQFVATREWLDIDDHRLFTASFERIRAQYSFSAKSLLRVIAQYVHNDFIGGARSGDFLGSVLYSYKINWQTVLFVGYGDERALDQRNELAQGPRSFFFKVSYAFLR